MGKGSALLRDKRIWWIAATIVVLAVVIFAMAALSTPKSSNREAGKKASPPTGSLAERASEALSNGDTSTAVTLAERALDEDPKNKTAQRVMDTVAEDEESAPEQSDPSPATNDGQPSDDSAYQRAIADMSSLLPRSISGWSPGTVVSQKTDAVVTFEPNATSDAARTAAKALVIAHDRGSESKATSFITKVDKRVYAKNAATTDVGGRDAYFGTDGTKLAVVAFARGRFAFEVIVTAQPGVKPSTLKQVATSVAKNLPAAK